MHAQDFLDQFRPETFTDLDRLLAAKDQVHQAIQLVAAVGRSYSPADSSDTFANLGYDTDHDRFVGWITHGRFQVMAALDVRTLTLRLLTANGRPHAELPLHGKTFAEGKAWLRPALAALGYDPEAFSTALPYTIPEYPTATEAPFQASDTEALAAFATSYGNGRRWQAYNASQFDLWTDIRTWPHHFDLYTRRRMAGGQWHMGVGFSPAFAENYHQPYYHITCLDTDGIDTDHLPEGLTGALRWHTGGWVGVVLLWEDFIQLADPREQAQRILDMTDVGMDALARLKNATLG